MYPRFLQVMINAQVDDLSSHNTKYTSPALTQKVFAIMRRIAGQEVGEKEEIQVFRVKKVKEGGRIVELDADEDVTLIDVDTVVKMDADIQERMKEDITAVKEVNAAEPIVFDDEEVTMTIAQILIKIKAKKARILDEEMAKRLQDEEIEQAAAKEKQKQDDLERAKNHVQTFLKSDRDEEHTKKRAAKETLLQESFKKLRAEVKVSGSSSTQQDILTDDPAEISKEDV
nr:hypothetical protein [Tanacetum cinerariifolium]